MSDVVDTRPGPVRIPWATSAESDELVAAWVAALGELEDVTRGRTANAGTYTYRYADLGDVLTTARGVLAKHDLAVSQVAVIEGREVAVTTTVFHRSGQWLVVEPLRLPAGQTAQQTGSAITYARRYAVMAALGLATDDDDGAAASTTQGEAEAEPEPEVRRLLNPGTAKAFLERAQAEDLNDDDVATIVEIATEGRTTKVEQAYADELPRLRVSFDNYLVHRLAQPSKPAEVEA